VPTIDAQAAVHHLTAADPVMARIIPSVGPFALRPDPEDAFLSLSRAIVYQQLSGKAAGTIFARFLALLAGGEPTPTAPNRTDPAWQPLTGAAPSLASVLARTEEELRSAGLSRQKIASLQDLAAHFASGELSGPNFNQWPDEEIIAHLTRVRGIGRWTAEMYLIFHLGRPDVLPVNDAGINRALHNLYGLPLTPKPAEVLAAGAPWRPWATVASWYLWRSLDIALPG
jgi:3-methyladenine DNA glycosylase/8-oxoguanine DNA glycosylase